MSIEIFYKEAEALSSVVRQLREGIETGASVPELCADMAEVATRMADLFEHENARIYNPLADPAKSTGLNALSMLQQARELHGDWLDHLTDWSAECIAADRETFARETATLLARMDHCVRQGSNDLYPFALAKGLIRLRA